MEWNQEAQKTALFTPKDLRHDANYIGLLLISVAAVSNIIFPLLAWGLTYFFGWIFTDAQPYYGLGALRFMLLYGVSYAIGMGSAALVSAFAGGKKHRLYHTGEEASSIGAGSLLLALLAGLTVCVIANLVASFLMSFAQSFGIVPPEMPSFMDKSLESLGLNVLVVCVLPALLEEMVFRHFILRSLLKYGTGFAIVVSSLLFGLLHGNILQIPFAFIVGLACAYLTVKTGSIWPAVMLHFLNNFMSTLLEYASQFAASDEQTQRINLFVLALVALIGLFSVIGLTALNSPLLRKASPLSLNAAMGEKAETQKPVKAGVYVKGLCSAAVFLISITLLLVMTILNTEFR